jgi:hypothetical protein
LAAVLLLAFSKFGSGFAYLQIRVHLVVLKHDYCNSCVIVCVVAVIDMSWLRKMAIHKKS